MNAPALTNVTAPLPGQTATGPMQGNAAATSNGPLAAFEALLTALLPQDPTLKAAADGSASRPAGLGPRNIMAKGDGALVEVSDATAVVEGSAPRPAGPGSRTIMAKGDAALADVFDATADDRVNITVDAIAGDAIAGDANAALLASMMVTQPRAAEAASAGTFAASENSPRASGQGKAPGPISTALPISLPTALPPPRGTLLQDAGGPDTSDIAASATDAGMPQSGETTRPLKAVTTAGPQAQPSQMSTRPSAPGVDAQPAPVTANQAAPADLADIKAAAPPTDTALAGDPAPAAVATLAPSLTQGQTVRQEPQSLRTSRTERARADSDSKEPGVPQAAPAAARATPVKSAAGPSGTGEGRVEAAESGVAEAEADGGAESPDSVPQAETRAMAQSSAPAAHTSHAVRGSPETVANLAAQIVKKLEGKSTRFDLELNPAGLGRVDVRLEIGAHGRITAAMTFDSPQAASDLKARSAELQQAMEQAGFDMSGGMSFDVAGDRGQQQQQAWRDQADSNGEAFRGRAFRAALDTAGDAADSAVNGALRLRRGINAGLDLRI